MNLDDLLFYLPGLASIPIVIAGMLGVWLVWRLAKRGKKSEPIEKASKK